MQLMHFAFTFILHPSFASLLKQAHEVHTHTHKQTQPHMHAHVNRELKEKECRRMRCNEVGREIFTCGGRVNLHEMMQCDDGKFRKFPPTFQTSLKDIFDRLFT